MRRGQGRRFLAGKLPSAKMLISAVKVGCSAVLRAIAFVFSGVAEYLGLIYGGACEALFDATLPVTKYLLSCKPLTPSLQVCEVSSTTVRLGIKGRLSSPWNVETYKVQRAELGANGEGAWETSYSDDGRYPSIGGLKPFHEYAFRVQASNFKGSSEWSSSTCVWTLMNPVDGGGLGPGYSWQQTSSEVVMDLPILRQLSEVKPKQVDITLGKLQHLRIRIQTPEGPETLLEGELYQRVQPFGSGSFWELVRLDGVTHLVVTFEKANSVKRQSYMQPHPTGFWKSVIKGHPQIDVDKVAVTR